MTHVGLLAGYVVLILLASLVGGWVPMYVRLTHTRMELAISFVAGAMLGVAVLLLLPHAFEALPAMNGGGGEAAGAIEPDHSGHSAHELLHPVTLWLLAGIMTMFFIERFFSFHHHEAPGESAEASGRTGGSSHEHDQSHDHAHGHSHGHGHGPTQGQSRHRLTWTGAAVGMSLHSLIDGVALAASVEAAGHDDGSGAARLAGLGTFFVIFLHKPFDSLTLGTLMAAGGWSRPARHLVNTLFSLLVLGGVAVFYLGLISGEEDRSMFLSAAVAFSAGTFMCIALSDLLPELQFHHHDRGKLSAMLLAGLASAWAISVLENRLHDSEEPEHGRGPGAAAAIEFAAISLGEEEAPWR